MRKEDRPIYLFIYLFGLFSYLSFLIEVHLDSELVAEDLWSVDEIDTVEPLVMRKSVTFIFISIPNFFFMILYLGRYG